MAKKEVEKKIEKETIKEAKKEAKKENKIKIEQEAKTIKKEWNKENTALLTENFQKHTWNELLRELPFDKKEIVEKAKELKLYQNK